MSKLAELRKANGMTQADVAKLLGVTNKAVGSWEQGKRNPKGSDMQKLEDYFSVPKEDIFPDTFSYSK